MKCITYKRDQTFHDNKTYPIVDEYRNIVEMLGSDVNVYNRNLRDDELEQERLRKIR